MTASASLGIEASKSYSHLDPLARCYDEFDRRLVIREEGR